MHLICQCVCISVHASILANICQMSWNLCVIYIWHNMDRTENGIYRTKDSFTDTKFSNTLRPMGKIFKSIFYVYIALSILKLTYVIQMYKSIFPIKNGINSINILYTGLPKCFQIHYSLFGRGGFLKRILTYLHCSK